MDRLKNLEELKNLRALLKKDVLKPDVNRLKVCCGLPCSVLGSHEVAKELEKESSKSDSKIEVVKTGCQGLCQKGPLVQVEPHNYFYYRVSPDKARQVISSTLSAGLPVRDLLYRDSFLEAPPE